MGKVKTVVQLIAIIGIIAAYAFRDILIAIDFEGFETVLSAYDTVVPIVSTVLLWVSVAITAWSGIVYVWQNRKYINTTK